MADKLTIIPATSEHIPLVLTFIRELADFEILSHEVVATEDSLRASLLGSHRTAEAVIAYWDDEPAGFAVFFHNFSTFLGRSGLYLEDVFVRPSYRGKGIGLQLMRYLAGVAVERNCGRFEWAVLDWNEKAIRFYESLGAESMDDWTVNRLSGEALSRLASWV